MKKRLNLRAKVNAKLASTIFLSGVSTISSQVHVVPVSCLCQKIDFSTILRVANVRFEASMTPLVFSSSFFEPTPQLPSTVHHSHHSTRL